MTATSLTTDLAIVQQLQNTPDLPERDRGAAEAVAAGLQDAKASTPAGPTPPLGGSSGRGPRPVTTPQTVALYLGHLASSGRSIATVQQARPLGHPPLSRRRDAEG